MDNQPVTPEEVVARALEQANNSELPIFVLHRAGYDWIARVAIRALLDRHMIEGP